MKIDFGGSWHDIQAVIYALIGSTIKIDFKDRKAHDETHHANWLPIQGGHAYISGPITVKVDNPAYPEENPIFRMVNPPKISTSDRAKVKKSSAFALARDSISLVLNVEIVDLNKDAIIKNLLKMLKDDWIDGLERALNHLHRVGFDHPDLDLIKKTVFTAQKRWE